MASPAQSPGPVTVWWARPLDPDTHPRLVALLDDRERTRMAAFRRPEDRHRYLAAHALARLVLAAHLDADPAAIAMDRTCRCGEQHGKPTLAASPESPGFSLTHSGELVGVALGPGAVGLDVEQHRGIEVDGMSDHVLSPAERSAYTLDQQSFLVTWTRKEALLKVTGDGLSSPMTGITLGPPDTDAVVRDWAGGPDGPVWVRDLASPLDDHPAAVAGLGPSAPDVRTEDGDAVLSG
ncbi:4'-phosphopantetheinyl transferase family protein [Pseudonocardia endophytica]|uniref:4'-phosphopantetheinyl transferase n=1 Tax=Pseudonocardia endophytica TaxID=401976 RepID=A0A4R1HUL6_PSEEN|nr:4'-phosphopantetheinyl transferase superfamily protein [Pseudonocardia endophytica]TCK25101.1 4'-phosphopantetheinyl transferase [Pseudonocardia endophytica]